MTEHKIFDFFNVLFTNITISVIFYLGKYYLFTRHICVVSLYCHLSNVTLSDNLKKLFRHSNKIDIDHGFRVLFFTFFIQEFHIRKVKICTCFSATLSSIGSTQRKSSTCFTVKLPYCLFTISASSFTSSRRFFIISFAASLSTFS